MHGESDGIPGNSSIEEARMRLLYISWYFDREAVTINLECLVNVLAG
jgi:hypothetical protein